MVKYAAACLAAIYMLCRNYRHTRQMHEVVLCAIALKWLALVYRAALNLKTKQPKKNFYIAEFKRETVALSASRPAEAHASATSSATMSAFA